MVTSGTKRKSTAARNPLVLGSVSWACRGRGENGVLGPDACDVEQVRHVAAQAVRCTVVDTGL